MGKKECGEFRKAIAAGVVIGGVIGVPFGKYTYEETLKQPSPYNYTTVKEKRENLKHDTSNYEKYLKQKGYTWLEIQEKLKEWEEKMELEKKLTYLIEEQEVLER